MLDFGSMTNKQIHVIARWAFNFASTTSRNPFWPDEKLNLYVRPSKMDFRCGR